MLNKLYKDDADPDNNTNFKTLNKCAEDSEVQLSKTPQYYTPQYNTLLQQIYNKWLRRPRIFYYKRAYSRVSARMLTQIYSSVDRSTLQMSCQLDSSSSSSASSNDHSNSEDVSTVVHLSSECTVLNVCTFVMPYSLVQFSLVCKSIHTIFLKQELVIFSEALRISFQPFLSMTWPRQQGRPKQYFMDLMTSLRKSLKNSSGLITAWVEWL